MWVACGWGEEHPPAPRTQLPWAPAAGHLGYLRGPGLDAPAMSACPATTHRPPPCLTPDLLMRCSCSSAEAQGNSEPQAWPMRTTAVPHQPARALLPHLSPLQEPAAAGCPECPQPPPRLPVSFQALVGTVAPLFWPLGWVIWTPATPRRHPPRWSVTETASWLVACPPVQASTYSHQKRGLGPDR